MNETYRIKVNIPLCFLIPQIYERKKQDFFSKLEHVKLSELIEMRPKIIFKYSFFKIPFD